MEAVEIEVNDKTHVDADGNKFTIDGGNFSASGDLGFQGTLFHELGHAVHHRLSKQMKKKWHNTIKKTKGMGVLSEYSKNISDDPEWRSEELVSEEAFAEMRRIQQREPEDWELLSKGKKIKRLGTSGHIVRMKQRDKLLSKLIPIYMKICKTCRATESITEAENKPSKTKTVFLYAKNNIPTEDKDKAVRASIYDGDRHTAITFQDKKKKNLQAIGEFLSKKF